MYQFEGLRLSYAQIASNLNVDEATVRKTVKLFRETGNVSKKVYDKSDLPRKLTEIVPFFIIQLAIQRPGILLERSKLKICTYLGSILMNQLYVDSSMYKASLGKKCS